MNNFMKYLTIIVMTSYLSADECEDDATGALLPFGGCAAMAPGFGCEGSGFGVNIWEECPVYCDTCPGECGNSACEWDESFQTCPDDCDPPPGCDLPDNNIYVNENGSVLYNSVSVCAYCEDPSYNDVTIDEGADVSWATSPADAQSGCETSSTLIVDMNMTQAECAAVPDL